MRPTSIVAFERLYAISLALGVVSGFVVIPAMRPIPGAPPAVAAVVSVAAWGSLIGGVAIGAVLIYFIARRGSDTARLIFLALVAIGSVTMLRSAVLGDGIAITPVLRVPGYVQAALQLVCAWLLFRPDAKAWFAAHGRR